MHGCGVIKCMIMRVFLQNSKTWDNAIFAELEKNMTRAESAGRTGRRMRVPHHGLLARSVEEAQAGWIGEVASGLRGEGDGQVAVNASDRARLQHPPLEQRQRRRMSRHCSILGSGHRRLSEAGRWRLTTLVVSGAAGRGRSSPTEPHGAGDDS